MLRDAMKITIRACEMRDADGLEWLLVKAPEGMEDDATLTAAARLIFYLDGGRRGVNVLQLSHSGDRLPNASAFPQDGRKPWHLPMIVPDLLRWRPLELKSACDDECP